MKRSLFAALFALVTLAFAAVSPPAHAADSSLQITIVIPPPGPYVMYSIKYDIACKMTSSANYWNQSRYIFEATGTSLDEDVTRPVGPYQGNGAWQGPTTYTFSKPAGSYTCGGYAIGTSPQNNPSWNAFTGWINITAP